VTIAIIGLGVTGLSFVQYCLERDLACAVYDTRDEPPGLHELRVLAPQIPLLKLEPAMVLNVTQVFLSPGVSQYHPTIAAAVALGIEVIGDVELFVREVNAPIIAITGTNGKSTVTTLVGEMAQKAGFKVGVGGNLGHAVLSFLQEPRHDLYVLELSSFQLERLTSLKNHYSTILNVTPDHLDRYPQGLAQYVAAKQLIYPHSQGMVYNRADPYTTPQVQVAQMSSFGLDEPQSGHWGVRVQNNKTYLAYGELCILDLDEMHLKGWHQVANALAALALGHQAGFSIESMCLVLKTFTGLPHRCTLVHQQDALTWINDSKGTNIGATLAAIEGLASVDSKIVLIAGGDGKGADFRLLRNVVKQHVRALVLLGKDANKLEEALGDLVLCQRVVDLTAAIPACIRFAKRNDKIVLSPACASTDMFRNFEERGGVFEAAVKAYYKKAPDFGHD